MGRGGVRWFGDIDLKGVQNGKGPEIGDCPGAPVGVRRPCSDSPSPFPPGVSWYMDDPLTTRVGNLGPSLV